MKVSLLGSGNIGGVLALLLSGLALDELILYDVVEGLPQGKALDISHASSLLNLKTSIRGTNNLRDIEDSSLCIVTAGVARKPGMSRDDLLKTNASIIKDIAEGIAKYSPRAIVIVVTNPLDAMAWLMLRLTGFERNRVMGMAGVLDSARYAYHISEVSSVSPNQINALVLGGHGDDMVTVRSLTNVNGVPIQHFLSEEKLTEIESRVKNSGAEIVSLLKTGSAFVSPAASCFLMARSIIFNEKSLLPCSSYLEGEYGLSDIFMGVPCLLGNKGVERILEVELAPAEQEQFRQSAQRVAALISQLKEIFNLR